MNESNETAVVKPRRRSASKSTKGAGEKPIKVGLYLSTDAARRLAVTSAMESTDRSAIVDELIRQHLRKYVVQVRGNRSEESTADGSEDRQEAVAA